MRTLSVQKTSPVYGIAYAFFIYALFLSGSALADTRQDAITAISELRMSGPDNSLADEIKSLEATLAMAEQYHQAHDTVASEQYYRLAIQKARILAARMPYLPTVPPLPTHEELSRPDSQQSASPLLSDMPLSATLEPASVESPAEPEQKSDSYSAEVVSEKLVGTASTYTIIKGDTLRLVAAKLGVSRQHLARMNKLDSKDLLQIGQQLKYNNRKIIPLRMQEGIVVNIPDRTLYHFKHGKLVRSLPVALGTATRNEKYVWQTPTGKFRITAKQEDPTWYVPPSIQAEMEEEGKDVIVSVPPGPDNPLGKYAIKTSLPGILIHSTTKPWSIYSFASHGCIRVYPAQMEEFFKEVKIHTPGEIIYRPVKLAVTEQGRVFLEVHQDVYSKSSDLAADARKLVEKHRLSERIDWKKFEVVLKQKLGVAEDITM